MGEELGMTMAIQAALGFVIRWAKNSDRVKWLNPNSLKTIHWIAVLSSIATALGLHFTFDGSLMEEWHFGVAGSSIQHMVIGFVGYVQQQTTANSVAFNQVHGLMSKPESAFMPTKPS